MRRRVVFVVGAVFAAVVGAGAALAQSTVSSLTGTIVDADGGALPGVTVTLTSPALVAGRQVATTDLRGGFRFPSLPVGVYVLEAELAGFKTVRQEGIRLGLGQELALRLVMELSALAEEITVTAESPLVSVVSNSVSTNLDQDFLLRQPLSRSFNALMSYAPGVNNLQAFGGTEGRQNAYTLDGVNVSNPASGTYWILPSVDWLQEVQVGGLGANAEFGGYTGGVFNAVTKSGGNELSGDITAYYTAKSLVSDNTGLGQKPEFSYRDVSASLGGAIARDRVWYFVSANAVEDKRTPLGAQASEDRSVRRFLAKLTWQVDEANQVLLLGDYDGVDTERRGVSVTTLPSASRRQDSPNYTYNATWESVVNASNFFTAKITGFDGKDDRLPYFGNKPGRFDADSGIAWDNARFTQLQHYQRQTLDAAWNLFVDGLLGGADSHTFKFGLGLERARSKESFIRNGGFSYYDDSYYCSSRQAYFANPACGVYSADFGDEIFLDGKHTGLALYAQDSLKFARLTVNFGLRYGAFTGGFKNGKDDAYDVTFFDPRFGIVWDVRGDARTAVKAHFGRYHEGMFTYLYDREESGQVFTPSYYCDWNTTTRKFDRCSTPRTNVAAMDSGINHPYVDQWVATVEQQLGKDMALGLDYVRRKFLDIVAMVNTVDNYDSLIAPNNPLTGGNLPFYDLLARPSFLLTNPAKAYRDYSSWVLRFDKRYSSGWYARASLVWADLKGNAFSSSGYVSEFRDKNGLTNADGKLPGFSEWEFKLSTSVDLPLNLEASAYYTYLSGEYWTPFVRVRGLFRNDPQNVYLVPRGSEQLPDRQLVDLRLAWNADIGEMGLGIFLDAFNVFNEDTALEVNQRWGEYRYNFRNHPAGSTWRKSASYGQVVAIERPRELRLGVRFSF